MESEPQVAASAASDAAHGLRRELGVGSLVLTQILYIVGASWVGVAATVGQAHVVLWIAAVALLAIIGVSLASAIAYALDGYGGFSVENPWHVRLASFAAIAIGATVVSLGLRIGKWVHNVGGAVHVLSFLALIIVPFVAMAHGRQVQYRPLDIAMPAATLFTLNMFTKLAMGAFSGFEYVAILAGECRDPARTIVRSVWISTPIIIAMFILGTCSVVAIVPHDQLDLITPLPQTLRLGLGDGSMGHAVAGAIVVMIILRQVANMCFTFAGSVRLPMVAAWQGQAPGSLGLG